MNMLRIAWIAVRELLYERVFYVLVCFACGSLGLSLLLGQMTYTEQYKLTLDFMLAGIEISMALFSVFMGISLFQKEIALGSVSLVLSKPIARPTFLLGKYLGQILVQFVVTAAMVGVTIGMTAFHEQAVLTPIIQSALMIFFEITVLTAITYFFAVNSGAITTAVVTLCLFALGHLRESVSKNLGSDYGVQGIWRFTKTILPDLELFNMKGLASYGFGITARELGWASLYALCCVSFFLIMASVTFSRKDILT
jgi:ABC-type transport system involved in multi-copper enzyme maturation permease subunit